jgi:peptidoglycan/LPS O-acetylase OafA/YrhL
MRDRPGSPRRLGHRPALDGIRGIAWGVVFCSHALTLPLALGQVAMFVFFALSGFLITGLLVEERTATGRVSLSSFFARRALRLLPALVFFLAGWLTVVLATGGHAPWTTTVPGGGTGAGTSPGLALQGAAAALVYATNWADIGGWFSGYVPLGHLWSLAVEEQFYLLWSPVVVLLLC